MRLRVRYDHGCESDWTGLPTCWSTSNLLPARGSDQGGRQAINKSLREGYSAISISRDISLLYTVVGQCASQAHDAFRHRYQAIASLLQEFATNPPGIRGKVPPVVTSRVWR